MKLIEAKQRLWQRGWTHKPTAEQPYRFEFINRKERAHCFANEQAVLDYVEDLIADSWSVGSRPVELTAHRVPPKAITHEAVKIVEAVQTGAVGPSEPIAALEDSNAASG